MMRPRQLAGHTERRSCNEGAKACDVQASGYVLMHELNG